MRWLTDLLLHTNERHRVVISVAAMLAICALALTPVTAQTLLPSRPIPLSFGMDADQAAQTLGVPLHYVRGRPGDELLLAIPNVKGAALASRSDALYLQFRRGRLTGWKGDWGTVRP